MAMIAAEDFSLTPTIRAHVENNLTKLKDLLPDSSMIRVFLSEPAHKTFKVLYKVRAWGKDLIAHSEGEDLYNSIEAAGRHLMRKIVQEKNSWTHHRRVRRFPDA